MNDLCADIGNGFIYEVFHFPESVTAAFFHTERDGFFRLSRNVFFGDFQFQQGQTECLEPLQIGVMRGNAGVRTDNQTDGFFLHHPFDRDGIWHDHGVDIAVTNRTSHFLNVFADKIQQNNGFRCLFHVSSISR